MTTVADQFTDSQIDEMKEAFNLFDRNKDGNVLIIQLGSLLKMLGIHTTDAELKVYIEEGIEEDGATIDFPEFLTLMSKVLLKSKSESSLLEAFQIFDKDENGYIPEEDFKTIMTDMGEKLKEDEYIKMMEDVEVEKGKGINYVKFAKRLFSNV